VDVVKGSTLVAGRSTAWNCSVMNQSTDGLIYFWFPNMTEGQTPQSIPSDAYLRGGGGDNTYYKAHCVDATHLLLARPYEGITGTGKGFAWAPDPASGLSNTFLGWGQQPYAQGIAGLAFHLAARALDGYDNVARDTYYGYAERSAEWLVNRGMDTTSGQGGMYLGVFYPCGFPVTTMDLMCGNPTYTPDQRRQLSAEVIRSLGQVYARTGAAYLVTAGDTLMSQMFSKPGTGGPSEDGFYLKEMNNKGFQISGTPPIGTAPKWTGQSFGFPLGGSSWPALRIGGGQLPVVRTAFVDIQLGNFEGAAQVRVIVTSPAGEAIQVNCSDSPCPIQVDARQKDHLAQIEYLSDMGIPLAVSGVFLLPLQ
jgi:hypothetical protein